jgi:hypothetical protein
MQLGWFLLLCISQAIHLSYVCCNLFATCFKRHLRFLVLLPSKWQETKHFFPNSGTRIWSGRFGVRIPTGLRCQPIGPLCLLFSAYLGSFLGVKRPGHEADHPPPLVTMPHQRYRQQAVYISLNRSVANIRCTASTSHRVKCNS